MPQDAGGAIFSAGIALGTIKYLAYPKPLASDFELKDFQFTQANFDAIKPMHAIYDATDPDLSKFSASGGKLLLYHGWSDPHISPLNSVAYLQCHAKDDGEAKVSQFARLFVLPGGYHFNGGDGPFDFALLSTIMRWVEGGVAPNMIMASHSPQGAGRGGRGRVVRLRPRIERARYFPYPMLAVYKGSGDINDAANFEAKPGPRVGAALLNWSGSSFYSASYEKWCEWNGTTMACRDNSR